ncbi:dTDP-4-dehydrorhamnose reductase [Cupriavidus gilardii]|uniref:dTDP-4-dehydrorhamnose reductase n=1 Tax=Cupriavidus gilardii TaxID=82541 RepID=UPI0007E3DFEF|nr:dTDP-4-dehydrorhamnose reductase [Cupriavidus gilardii]
MRHSEADAPTLLVLGSNGQVGFELRRSLIPLGRVVARDRTACNLAHPDEIRRVLREVRPDVIVNAAAYTAVDKAESEADLAYAINGTAPGILAEEAKALGSLLVHYSTDYVFDGTKAGPYVETDATNPQSVYGKSKLAGEQAILAVSGDSLIFRTCWVAGVHGANFAKTMLRLARERDRLRVVADQYGAPTTASLISDVTAHAIARRRLPGTDVEAMTGLFHLAAAGETTWHAYASEVVRYAADRGVELKADADAIEAISTAEYPLPAPRPRNSMLNTSKLQQCFGIFLPDWKSGIHHMLDHILH